MMALAPWDTVTVSRKNKEFTFAPILSFRPDRSSSGLALFYYEELKDGRVVREWGFGLGGNCEPPEISERMWKEAERKFGGDRPIKVCPYDD
jgi:hypothetical protein